MRKPLLFAVCALCPVLATAATPLRINSWEASFYIKQQNSFEVEYDAYNYVDVYDDVGFGFRIGYNYTSNFNLNVKFDALNSPYEASFTNPADPSESHRFRETLSQWSFMLNGLYNFSAGDFSPYVEAGLGWITSDSNVADGPPITDCWWDYWWGYSCDVWQTTYSESNFAYEVGAGLRYDFPNGWFVRGGVLSRWTKFDYATGTSNLTGVQLELGSLVWTYY